MRKKEIDTRRIQLMIQAVIIAAVVLLVAVAVLGRGQNVPPPAPGNLTAAASFPSDVPVPAVGSIHNAALPLPSGQSQFTRSFATSSTVAATFSFYKHFLASAAGWRVLAEASRPADPAHKSLLAQNGSGILTVNVSAAPSVSLPLTAMVQLVFVTAPNSASSSR